MEMNANENNISRRRFLRIIGWGAFFITIGVSVIAAIRFLFPRVLFEQPSIFKIGSPAEFKTGSGSGYADAAQVYEKWKDPHSVWIVKEKNRLYAVHARCTHLGCTPNWFADDKVFKCPCHGSQFQSNGFNFAGPAPRPLDRFKIYIGDDGNILIDKSRIYSYRDFDDKGSYLEI